jgi:hypothetical protein
MRLPLLLEEAPDGPAGAGRKQIPFGNGKTERGNADTATQRGQNQQLCY